MNWRTDGDDLKVDTAEGEEAEPDKALVAAARKAAATLAAKLAGSKDHHVEITGHETTSGRGFRPGHVTITVSRIGPKR